MTSLVDVVVEAVSIDGDWIKVIASLGIGGIFVEGFRSFSGRKNMDANTAKVITDAATTLLLPLKEQVEDMQAQLVEEKTKRQRERQSMKLEISELRGLLRDCRARLDGGGRESNPTSRKT